MAPTTHGLLLLWGFGPSACPAATPCPAPATGSSTRSPEVVAHPAAGTQTSAPAPWCSYLHTQRSQPHRRQSGIRFTQGRGLTVLIKPRAQSDKLLISHPYIQSALSSLFTLQLFFSNLPRLISFPTFVPLTKHSLILNPFPHPPSKIL